LPSISVALPTSSPNLQHAYRKLLLWEDQGRVRGRASHDRTFPSLLSKSTRPQDDGLTARQTLCHCADCRKISGGNYSNNFIVPSERFKVVEGTPKKISKIADTTGKEITVKSFAHMCLLHLLSVPKLDFPLYRVLAEFAPRKARAFSHCCSLSRKLFSIHTDKALRATSVETVGQHCSDMGIPLVVLMV
jgi:hypothetical protein